MASSSHQAARELAHEFTPTLVEVFAVQRPQKRAPARPQGQRRLRRRSPGMSTHAKALLIATVVLLMVSAYAFGVLGRDNAVGLALQNAVNPPLPVTAPPSIAPELVIPLETIPIGEPWFSAPDAPAVDEALGAPTDPAPKVSKRRKR